MAELPIPRDGIALRDPGGYLPAAGQGALGRA